MEAWEKTLSESVAKSWQPPDRRPPSFWAETNVVLPSSVRTSEYRRDTTPWTTPILDALQDPGVSFITFYAPTQTGKSTIVECGIPWMLMNSPGNIMVTCQTDADVELWGESRLWPLFEKCKPVAELLSKLSRSARKKTRVIFPHCFVEIQGPGLNSLQSKSIRYAFNDEAWMYKPGTLSQIIARTTAVWNRKIITMSQGGEVGDDLDVVWNEGSQELFSYQCSCGAVHPFSLKSLKWDDNEVTRDLDTRAWNWLEVRKTVRHYCESCGKETADTLEGRRGLSTNGVYVPTNLTAPTTKRSFRVDGTAVYWMPWADIVEQYLKALDAIRKGNAGPLKTFVQKVEATPWAEKESLALDADQIIGSGYKKEDYAGGGKIDGEYTRIMAVDVQQLGFWVVIRAIRKDASSRLLYEGHVDTKDDLKALAQKYRVPANLVMVDAGWDRANVWIMCSQNNWTSMIGRGEQDSWIHLKRDRFGKEKKISKIYSPQQSFVITGQHGSGSRANPARAARGYYWSNRGVKDILNRFRCGQAMPWDLPDDLSEKYREHLVAEIKDDTGRWVPRYKNCPNHLWDCEAMIMCTMVILGLIGGEEVDAAESNV